MRHENTWQAFVLRSQSLIVLSNDAEIKESSMGDIANEITLVRVLELAYSLERQRINTHLSRCPLK